MRAAVEPSARYEGPRANYRAAKRGTFVPNGRQVEPRLAHDDLTNPITGLRKRKIPTSTQRPTRGTNVSIVYPRLVHRELGDAAPCSIHEGDVLFVGKSDTVFGSGTSRLSRVCSWRHLNTLLALPENHLGLADAKLGERIVNVRKRQRDALKHRVNHDEDTLKRAVQAKQAVDTTNFKSFQGHTKQSLEIAQASLQMAEACVAEGDVPHINPFQDWLAVPAFFKWVPDGVLHSTESTLQTSSEMYPAKIDSELLINVAVSGPCHLRNSKRDKDPQFFDDAPAPGDEVFLCVVAVQKESAFSFVIKPVTTRHMYGLACVNQTAAETSQRRLGGTSTQFSAEDLRRTVAAWRIGKVLDSHMVTGKHSKLGICVNVELLMRDDLWRSIHHENAAAGSAALCYNAWPSAAKDGGEEVADGEEAAGGEETGGGEADGEEMGGGEADGEEAGGEEMGEEKTRVPEEAIRRAAEALEREVKAKDGGADPQQLEATQMRALANPFAGVDMLSIVPMNRNRADNNDALYSLGAFLHHFAVLVLSTGKGTPFDISKFASEKLKLSGTLDIAGTRFIQKAPISYPMVLVASLVKIVTDVLSTTWSAQNCYLRVLRSFQQTGFVSAIDAAAVEGAELLTHEGMCNAFSHIDDGHITQKLCETLKQQSCDLAKSANSVRFDRKCLDVINNGALVSINLNLKSTDPGQATRISNALNLLFGLPNRYPWSNLKDTTWSRPTVDSNIWETWVAQHDNALLGMSNVSKLSNVPFGVVHALVIMLLTGRLNLQMLPGQFSSSVQSIAGVPDGAGSLLSPPGGAQGRQPEILREVANLFAPCNETLPPFFVEMDTPSSTASWYTVDPPQACHGEANGGFSTFAPSTSGLSLLDLSQSAQTLRAQAIEIRRRSALQHDWNSTAATPSTLFVDARSTAAVALHVSFALAAMWWIE